MRYFRCKCGKRAVWSSMGVSDCDGCEVCNTTLAGNPEGHTEPIPHDPIEETTSTTRDGVTVTETRRFCGRCMKRLPPAAALPRGGADV